jgi:hypothetical protein
MKEINVIKFTLLHLINSELVKIESCSLPRKADIRLVKNFLVRKRVPRELISEIEFTGKRGTDIIGRYEFKQERPIRILIIEAKGGSYFYAIYTMFGQFICAKTSPSPYYWFGFTLPGFWRPKVRKYLINAENGRMKPIIKDLIKKYTKNGQGLYFYWVNTNGGVNKETWRQTLTREFVR